MIKERIQADTFVHTIYYCVEVCLSIHPYRSFIRVAWEAGAASSSELQVRGGVHPGQVASFSALCVSIYLNINISPTHCPPSLLFFTWPHDLRPDLVQAAHKRQKHLTSFCTFLKSETFSLLYCKSSRWQHHFLLQDFMQNVC